MWQQWTVGVVVVLAGVYALWYWLPASLRTRLGRLQKNLGEVPGCGACSSCGSCSSPGKADAPIVDSTRQPLWIKTQR